LIKTTAIEGFYMASKSRGDDEPSKAPAAQSDRSKPDPDSQVSDDRVARPSRKQDRRDSRADDRDLPPDDGGVESDRGSVVKQDRNFDAGPAPPK
jgi:hypothetical protein